MTEQDKKIQALLKGNFDAPTPSLDFTHNIMGKIATQEVQVTQAKFEYVPVISKIGWMLIGGLYLFFVFLGLTGTQESKFTVTTYIPVFHIDSSVAHSPIVWVAVWSIFALLLIDRLSVKSKLH